MKYLHSFLLFGFGILGLVLIPDSFGDGGGGNSGVVSGRDDHDDPASIGGSSDKPDSSGSTWDDSVKGGKDKKSLPSDGDSLKNDDHVIPMALSNIQDSQKRVIPVQLRLMLARVTGESELKKQK